MGNESLFNEARNWLVGGVNSPIRASIKPFPFFTDHARGAYIWDVEGKRYCDYCLAYGPLVLGHADPDVVGSVKTQLERGTTYGTPTGLEVEFAKKVCELAPNVEMVRAVNSGTEATMAALRLARSITGRDAVATLDGGYHGSHDSVLAKRDGNGVVASSSGVTRHHVHATRIVGYNNPEALSDALGDEVVAAFIMEPVMGNVGCVTPRKGYLDEVRKICNETGTLLIFDETITGFRLSLGGAQEHYGVDADIVTYGKIAGGGLPIGVIGSSKENMENFSPLGKVYNAGTFSGNPLSMAGGLAALEKISAGGALEKVHSMHERLVGGIRDLLPEGSSLGSAPGMFQIYLGQENVHNANDAHNADFERFMAFWKNMLSKGYFLPPSHFESNFISSCHDKDIVDSTIDAIGDAFQ